MSVVKMAGIVNDSITDGVGLRVTLFMQGCPHHCEGCHNPQTHDFNGGYEMTSEELIQKIDSNHIITGVTFSGGEPMCQAEALIPIAQYVKNRGLNLAIYSGYLFEVLQKHSNPSVRKLLSMSDVLVDGRFEIQKRTLAYKFAGSTNQRKIDVQKSLATNTIVLMDGEWV